MHSPRFDRHYSYWLVAWFVVYVVCRLVRRSTPYLVNPLWVLIGAAVVNACFVLYTLYLVATGALTTHQRPELWWAVGAFVVVNVCIKVVPVLVLRYADPMRFPLPTVREGVRSLVVALAVFGVWVMWLQATGGVWSARGEPTWRDKVRYGVAVGDGPLMHVVRRAVSR